MVEDADAPVERRVDELLGQHQVGLLFDALDRRHQRGMIFDLEDPARERTIRDLEHDRIAQLLLDPLGATRVAHDRLRTRHASLAEGLGEIDLVRAAQDRGRVIDHRDPLVPRLLGEPVGVVVEVGGLADEERIELHQPPEVPARDQLDGDIHVFPHAGELAQGPGIRGRQRIGGIVQDGQGVLRGTLRTRRRPSAPGELLERLLQSLPRVAPELADRHGMDRMDMPVGMGLDLHLQARTAEGIECPPGQLFEPGLVAAPEEDRQRPVSAFDAVVGHDLLQSRVQPRQRVAVQPLPVQVEHDLGRGNDAQALRFGQKRAVVPDTEILVVAAEVDDASCRRQARHGLANELARRDDVVIGLGGGEISCPVYHQDVSSHRRPPSGAGAERP